MKFKKYNLLIISTIIILAVSRMLPHPPNFTPLGGIAVLGAAYFNKGIWKYLIPILAFYISDLLVSNLLFRSFYPGSGLLWFTDHMIWNYVAILCIVALSALLMKNKSWKNLLGASVLGAVLFFLISNFGSWIGNPMYPNNFGGLISSYIAGIPFFGNTLVSTILFSALGYGVIEYGGSFLHKTEVA